MGRKSINVLYVDDEMNNLKSFKANFRDQYNVYIALSGKEGIEILRNHTIHIVISDLRMPEMSGSEFLIEAKKISERSIRMLLTAYTDPTSVKDAVNHANLFRCLDKPFIEQNIHDAIEEAYQVYKNREEGRIIIIELMKANEKLGTVLEQKLLLAKLIVASNEFLN